MAILEVTDLSHSFGDKKIFDHINLQLFRGDKIGLTGLNGAGKSTLIRMLTGELIPDEGSVRWDKRAHVGYLDQQATIDQTLDIRSYLHGAFAALFQAAQELDALNARIAAASGQELTELLTQAGERQNMLENGNFYAVDSEIEKVAAGLGITAFGLETPVSRLSGGQRARVMLAKLLLAAPDVLLLDEPTNFLDTAHIDWLAKYLAAFKGSFVLVSHDFTFLNRVVNCICDIEFTGLTRYNGSYEHFVRLKELHREEHIREYDRQQKEISKLEDYIDRNLYRASTTRMAQSRRKKLEKMEKIARPQQSPKPTFQFRYQSIAPKPVLRVKNLEVGYDQPLLPPISLRLMADEKMNVSGFNGIGKTTFLKTVAGMLPAVSGRIRRDDDVVIDYFEQENAWDDPQRTPLQLIKDEHPTMKDKDVRSQLARCGLRADLVNQPIATLSGGEQAKVKLCRLVLRPCNLLILDEPTNHLDVDAIEQLKRAILEFPGAVLFVSHSPQFCEDIGGSTLNMEALFDA